jgi:hypothetical protein
MTLADDLKTLLPSIRRIPGQLGIRPHTVQVVTGTWTGSYVGRGTEGTELISVNEDGQPPKVQFANDEQIALGNLAKGDVTIGPITPPDALADLVPAVNAHQTVHVILTGPEFPNGARFRIFEVKTDRALHWILRARPVEEFAE